MLISSAILNIVLNVDFSEFRIICFGKFPAADWLTHWKKEEIDFLPGTSRLSCFARKSNYSFLSRPYSNCYYLNMFLFLFFKEANILREANDEAELNTLENQAFWNGLLAPLLPGKQME